MLRLERLQRIGEHHFCLLLTTAWVVSTAATSAAFAATQFSAQVDRNRIALDETVSLYLTLKADTRSGAGSPTITAPDFEVVNESSSVSFESYYDSTQGGFTTQNKQQIIKVLRPNRTGTLTISGIRLSADGKQYSAPNILVQVVPAGTASPTARGVTRGESTKPAFVRAEVDKRTAYKGEQIIVSYYLYHQSRIFNIQVDKYPVLNGFLREDIDLPIVTQRLSSESITVGGAPYQRILLARYAAYPLQEGTLSIDSMALKFNYYTNPGRSRGDQDDPFFGFFQQMTPQVGSSQSDRIDIAVDALPLAGRPESFSGGIGDFNLTSAVDKYEVHANEAVNLTVKVDGKGNTASIKEPKAQWPESVELYDTKGKSTPNPVGGGERVFEFLLIPRNPGKVELPSLVFGFFDPEKKTYYTKATEPLTLTVLEPLPGSVPPSSSVGKSPSFVAPTEGTKSGMETRSKKPDMRYLKPPTENGAPLFWQPVWRILYWSCTGALLFLLGLIGLDFFRKNRKRSAENELRVSESLPKKWENLRKLGQTSGNDTQPWNEILSAYDTLSHLVLDSIERTYQVGAKSVPLQDLRTVLVEEKALSAQIWERITRLLEFSDLVRFASSVGAVSEGAARSELSRWVAEAEGIVRTLERRTPERTSQKKK